MASFFAGQDERNAQYIGNFEPSYISRQAICSLYPVKALMNMQKL